MSKRTILSAVAASILATTSVFAQVPPDAPVPPAHSDAHAGGWTERLTRAHDRLGITPAQQPQWDALVAVMRENAQAMRADPAVQALRSSGLDGLQQVRAAAEVARQRADGMQRLVPATEALYAVLSPEQRQIADRDITRIMHRDHQG